MDAQASQRGAGTGWFHPGEVVMVAYARRDMTADQRGEQLQALLHSDARAHLQSDQSTTRSFVFDAPGEDRSLVFFVHKLARGEARRAVKEAVESIHTALPDARNGQLELLGAMPHWHVRAHELTGGGSPGSHPEPVYPDQVPNGSRRRVYTPATAVFASAGTTSVPVAVLDTGIDLSTARGRAEQLHNEQLIETIDWLLQRETADANYANERQQVQQHHSEGGSAEAYPMPDHGLFVAGLIHAMAPVAPLTLEPVLDDMGGGDLSLLLLGLQRVLARKQPRDPQIINLSLGFRPHPARLPAAWYGLQRPHDARYRPAEELFDSHRDQRWVLAHRNEVNRTVGLLQDGLNELGRYLNLNNCLVVAAAGNDSLVSTETGHVRLEPRLPARFENVLGVAATTGNPLQAAAYSNFGDEQALGDHVATFGGGVSDGLEPQDGVISVYSGEFPSRRPNETGWAYWSGTSFATAIVSGIAANFWAAHADRDAAGVLADLHAQAAASGTYVPELRTPSIEVRGTWSS